MTDEIECCISCAEPLDERAGSDGRCFRHARLFACTGCERPLVPGKVRWLGGRPACANCALAGEETRAA